MLKSLKVNLISYSAFKRYTCKSTYGLGVMRVKSNEGGEGEDGDGIHVVVDAR